MKKTISLVMAALSIPTMVYATPVEFMELENDTVLIANTMTKEEEKYEQMKMTQKREDRSMITPKDFSGGVSNGDYDYGYEEYVFISGEPIKFVGKVTETSKKKENEETITYKFKLESEDKKNKLNRSVTYKKEFTLYNQLNQLVEVMKVDKFKEDIEIDGNKYTMDYYELNKSDIIDKRPASDFSNGNIKGTKYYDINNGEGRATIEMTGGNVGYENIWGRTTTQIIDNVIKVVALDTGNSDLEEWSGTYSFQTSESEVTGLKYSDNDANLSSISGGYLQVKNRSSISQYDYDVKKDRGRVSLNKTHTPKLQRLVVPKFRDVNGHWAEDSIKKLYSIAIYEDGRESIFSPDTNMNRMEFTVAMMKASDIRAETAEEKASRRGSRKNKKDKVVEISPFKDISVDDNNYIFIKNGIDRGIIRGYNEDDFGPDKPLTRAEAITMIIRALGFESKAPNPGYMTSFSDDRSIPNWAKDSIYMAREIGLVSGDNNNKVNPNRNLTRAEASVLVVKYLEFLEKDLQKDYRYNIVNFR